jgi:hypothetical protein
MTRPNKPQGRSLGGAASGRVHPTIREGTCTGYAGTLRKRLHCFRGGDGLAAHANYAGGEVECAYLACAADFVVAENGVGVGNLLQAQAGAGARGIRDGSAGRHSRAALQCVASREYSSLQPCYEPSPPKQRRSHGTQAPIVQYLRHRARVGAAEDAPGIWLKLKVAWALVKRATRLGDAALRDARVTLVTISATARHYHGIIMGEEETLDPPTMRASTVPSHWSRGWLVCR